MDRDQIFQLQPLKFCDGFILGMKKKTGDDEAHNGPRC